MIMKTNKPLINRFEFKEFFSMGYGLPVGSEPDGVTNADWCKGGVECPRSKYQAMMSKKMKKKMKK